MQNETLNPVDSHLDQVTIKHLTWKPGAMRELAVAVLHHAMLTGSGQEFYPDEVKLDEPLAWLLSESPNCTGTCYRNLKVAGIIEPTGHFRRSNMERRAKSRGRTVFAYTLASRARAETFLQRNGDVAIPAHPQQEMKLV
jgi:hypothetical protein